MTDLVQRLRERDADTGYQLRAAAANRIQWLEAERDELSQLAAQANKRIEALELENAELRKDAERYRWMRDQNADPEAGFYVGDATDDLPGDFDWVGSDLDVAIDRAMKEQT